MTVDTPHTNDIIAEVSRWLTGEFSPQLPETRIRAIVCAARRDLDGQIVPEAMGEMLHRLARFRVLRALETR